ncbi:MAG: metallophosphoesterase family protein [Caulobacter sp.]|nr:metallophosphoesterase family protein [Caulobacter sp.]
MSPGYRLRLPVLAGRRGNRALGDRRIFAIGDIHGCDDLLSALLTEITSATAADAKGPLLIFLGDYVDRGPDSRNVIERLNSLAARGISARFLCGNHEEVLLRFLERPESAGDWLEFGGRSTLLSYGVHPPDDVLHSQAWQDVRMALLTALPDSHLRFLRSLEDSIDLGDFLFVHAGVDPSRPLEQQKSHDLRWMREPFLSDPRQLTRMIVHGHSPTLKPHFDRRRIGIDTWAYHSGILTAVELFGTRVRFLQARRQGEEIRSTWMDTKGNSQEVHSSGSVLPQP